MPGAHWRMMHAMRCLFTIALAGLVLAPPAAPQSAPLPGVDQVLDHYVQSLGGKDAIEKVTSRSLKGTVENSDDGTTSPVEVLAKAPNKYLEVISLGDAGQLQQCWNGETGWGKDPDSGLHDMEKADQVAARR